MKADLILSRGRIRTLGRTGLTLHSHLAIAGGTVVAVGGDEVMRLRGPSTRVTPLGGAAVLPGFNDAHAHVVYYGLTRFGVDLAGATTVDAMLQRIRRHGRMLRPGEWQTGMGFRTDELEHARAPHRKELDTATGQRPLYIDERGGHSRVANTAALDAAGVTGATLDPPGGRIGRDPDGTPNGLLFESAMRLVADVQPAPSLRRRVDGILEAQKLLLSRGITSVGAAVNRGFAADLHAYQLLAADGRLKMRVNEFLSWELLDAALGLGIRAGFGGSLVRAGPVKVFVDGGGRQAAMRSGGGTWRTTAVELAALVAKASRAGLQVAAHAIGDAAIAAMCDAVEAAGAGGLRHRVEHCSICPPDLQERLARLGMIAVMQPMLASMAAAMPAGMFSFADRNQLAAHAALMRRGVRVAFSSDLPVSADPNPWPGIRAAVDDPVNGVTVLQALRAYTSGGAYASFEEQSKGTLDAGMMADLQIYEEDPLDTPRADWDGLRPARVMLGGVPVA